MMANEVRCHFLANCSSRKLSDAIGNGNTVVPSACMFEQEAGPFELSSDLVIEGGGEPQIPSLALLPGNF